MSLLDIHANITYSAIAPLVGLEPIARYTLAAKCPDCGAHSWTIHQDNRTLEEWYYCSQCKASGSIIAMAAKRLGMSEVEAIRHFQSELGCNFSDNSISSYESSLQVVANYAKLWRNALNLVRQPGRLSNDQLSFLSKLGWMPGSTMSPERQLAGPWKLYRLAPADAVKPYLPTRQNVNGKCLRIEPKKKESLVVVPFYRTPKAIGSFICLSPRREYYTDPGKNSPQSGETGFAGLQLLPAMHSGTVVMTSMLKNAMRLQLRHFSSNQNPLPMLCYRQQYSPGSKRHWGILSDRQLVFWERGPTAVMIHQAMLTNAHISWLGPSKSRQQSQEISGSRWRAWINHDPAIDMWRKIVRNARPYEAALKNWARSATDAEKVKLLKDAELYEENVATFVRSFLDKGVKQSIGRKVRVPTLKNAKATTFWTVVEERNGKWYDNAGNVRLPGIVRITHIVVRPSGVREYVGYFKSGDKKIEFQVADKEASYQWLESHVMSSGTYMYQDFYTNQFRNHKSDNFCPFKAAARFTEPEIVVGLDSIGWDGAGFQFRGSRLTDGQFIQNPDFKLPKESPGPRSSHCRLREETKTALCKSNREMELVWSLGLAIAAQVTAPAVELPPLGIWLHRSNDIFLQTLLNRFEVFKGPYEDWKHNWPRKLDSPQKVAKTDASGYFVTYGRKRPPVAWDNLMYIDAQGEELQPRLISRAANKIVLHYLRQFTREKVDYPGNWESWLKDTHARMQAYFDFVDTPALREAYDRINLKS